MESGNRCPAKQVRPTKRVLYPSAKHCDRRAMLYRPSTWRLLFGGKWRENRGETETANNTAVYIYLAPEAKSFVWLLVFTSKCFVANGYLLSKIQCIMYG